MPAAGGDPVGSVADEAARLLAALRGASTAPAHHGEPDPEPGPPTGSDEPVAGSGARVGTGTTGSHDGCGWCPVCAAARALRPETVDAVADVLALGVDGLRGLAATLRARTATDRTDSPAATNQHDRGDQS